MNACTTPARVHSFQLFGARARYKNHETTTIEIAAAPQNVPVVITRDSLHVRTIEHHPAHGSGEREYRQHQYCERHSTQREPLPIGRRHIVESRHV